MKKSMARCEWQFTLEMTELKSLLRGYGVELDAASVEAQNAECHGAAVSKFQDEGVRLEPYLVPRVFALATKAMSKLDLQMPLEIHCIADGQVNGYAVRERLDLDSPVILCLTSAALEQLTDRELLFLLGHELAHIRLGHDQVHAARRVAIAAEGEQGGYFAESAFLRWARCTEVSADRAGYLCCGELHAAAHTMVKSALGLSSSNVNSDLRSLLSGARRHMKTLPTQSASATGHPLLPLRLLALEGFASTAASGPAARDWDAQIAALLLRMARGPRGPVENAGMTLTADVGVELVAKDGDLGCAELKKVLDVLFEDFTDSPEGSVLASRSSREKRIRQALAVLAAKADLPYKRALLSRLGDIAAVDGVMRQPEESLLLDIARRLKLSEEEASEIVRAAWRKRPKPEDSFAMNISRGLRNRLEREILRKR